jgi:hypothetical protein
LKQGKPITFAPAVIRPGNHSVMDLIEEPDWPPSLSRLKKTALLIFANVRRQGTRLSVMDRIKRLVMIWSVKKLLKVLKRIACMLFWKCP